MIGIIDKKFILIYLLKKAFNDHFLRKCIIVKKLDQ